MTAIRSNLSSPSQKAICLGVALLFCAVPPAAMAQARSPASSLSKLPQKVRTEVDQLVVGDAVARSTAAARLGEMGQAAVPAIPWLLGAANDDRSVVSLEYGNVSVRFIVGKALAKLGAPAFAYLRSVLDSPQASPTQREQAVAALGFGQYAGALDLLTKQIDVADADVGLLAEALIRSAGCFLPDKRVMDIILRVAELQQKPDRKAQHLDHLRTITGQEFSTTADARTWWETNGSTAQLRNDFLSLCATK